MTPDRNDILKLFREGSAQERAEFVLARPPHSLRDAAERLARADDMVDRVKAVAVLSAAYCSSLETAEVGAELAIAGHALGAAALGKYPALRADTVARMAADGVGSLRRLGRKDEALALCVRALPGLEAADPSGLHVQSLRRARIELLLELDRIDEAEEALEAFAATAPVGGAVHITALRARLAATRTSRTGLQEERQAERPRPPSPVELDLERERARIAAVQTREISWNCEGEIPLPLSGARPPRPFASAPDRATGATETSERGVRLTRYPLIDLTGSIEPRAHVELLVDLSLAPDSRTQGAPIPLLLPPSSPEELEICVKLDAPELVFEPGRDAGVITVKKDAPSVPFATNARVVADLGGREAIVVNALFSCNGRHSGFARRAFLVSEAEERGAPRPDPHEQEVAGSFSAEPGAPSPKLTVMIYSPGDAGVFCWYLQLAEEARDTPGLPRRLLDRTELGTGSVPFVEGLFAGAEELSTDHLPLFQGAGDTLYDLTPRAFKEAYWALVDRFGPEFPIQFVSEDLFTPWELMRPSRDGTPSQFLCLTHPVARWFLKHQSALLSSIQRGKVVTIAPDYTGCARLKPLPAARAESMALLKALEQRAAEEKGERPEVLALLTDAGHADVALIHFAGHGTAPVNEAARAVLCLEDGDLRALEVARGETQLGVHRHPLVLLNACEVARPGLNLGVLGGFAEAFIKRDFGGFIAPLWAIHDVAAAQMTASFVRAVVQDRRDFASALRDIRRCYGQRSPTALSYVYYGDVMARFV